jgi:uncharacterized membrane protein YraQ (UPF0718 family)
MSADPELAATNAIAGSKRALLLGTLGFAAIAVVGLAWAKWYPYAQKIPAVAGSHTLGKSILTGTAAAPPEPSWRSAVDYTLSYGRSIWPALVAGLLIAAAVEALLPARRLHKLFRHDRGQVAGTVSGGLLALPSMMCTCCAAPATLSIRRQGVPVSSALAYWLGNPVLNPAALAFMVIVLPWQFVAVRLITGVVLVFGVTMAVARLAGAGRVVAPGAEKSYGAGPEATDVISAGRRFVTSLGRLSVRLLPEYLVVVLALGGLRGWLFPVGHGLAGWGVLAVIVLAVIGTLFVIPTAGEIPIIQGLLSAGVGWGAAGALILTLPALSLPSMLMVRRAFPARIIVAVGLSVAALGVLGAGLLVGLT